MLKYLRDFIKFVSDTVDAKMSKYKAFLVVFSIFS